MITVTGGKLTTYRRMAADAVDVVGGVGAHHADALALFHHAVDDSDQHHDAEIDVVPAIDQQRLQRRIAVALRAAFAERLTSMADMPNTTHLNVVDRDRMCVSLTAPRTAATTTSTPSTTSCSATSSATPTASPPCRRLRTSRRVARVRVVGGNLPVAEASAEAAQNPGPLGQEEDEEHGCGREMRGDEEGEKVRLVLAQIPPEQLWQDHRVAEAGDREELGDPLEETYYDRLEVCDQAIGSGDEQH